MDHSTKAGASGRRDFALGGEKGLLRAGKTGIVTVSATLRRRTALETVRETGLKKPFPVRSALRNRAYELGVSATGY